MPPHSLQNSEIRKWYQNEPKFNCLYWRNNLFKIQDRAYVLNIDGYTPIGTHWIALYANDNNITRFDSFEVEHTPKEI